MSDDGYEAIDYRGADASLLQPSRLRPRVLVCEDDPSIRTLVSALLGREQFEVLAVSNGVEAIAMLDDSFAVILLDLMMPSRNGYDVLGHLQQSNPALLERVIVVTARADLVRQPLAVPVAQAMTKPFDIQELLAAVQRVASHS